MTPMLRQGLDRLERLLAPRSLPIRDQLVPMEGRPLADEGQRPALWGACDDFPVEVPSPGVREAQEAARLAYTRRQAAEALGVSISTVDRHIVPAIETVKLPWGQRLIPVDELERLLHDHREPARGRPARRPAGRPTTLPLSVLERIRLEYACGRGLSQIARALTDDGVPTAHGGRQWWPSTVRAVLLRVAA